MKQDSWEIEDFQNNIQDLFVNRFLWFFKE